MTSINSSFHILTLDHFLVSLIPVSKLELNTPLFVCGTELKASLFDSKLYQKFTTE